MSLLRVNRNQTGNNVSNFILYISKVLGLCVILQLNDAYSVKSFALTDEIQLRDSQFPSG